MKRFFTNGLLILLTLGAFSCNEQEQQSEKQDSTTNSSPNTMNSYLSLFEIPANDLDRAINFYEKVFDLPIEKMDIPGMEMGVFPYENQLINGVIIKGEGYEPSSSGVTIYLNAGEDLQVVLDKVEQNGGKVILPKTAHADESGYFAIFLDSEGNKLGLNSPG